MNKQRTLAQDAAKGLMIIAVIMFKDDETVPSEQLLDYEVVIKYIVDVLQGHLIDKYSSPEGRIVIL